MMVEPQVNILGSIFMMNERVSITKILFLVLIGIDLYRE